LQSQTLNTAIVADIHKRSCRYPAGAAGLTQATANNNKRWSSWKSWSRPDGLPSHWFLSLPGCCWYCRISI